jgi:lipoyl(octanoyl) transferase
MRADPPPCPSPNATDVALQAYLLGTVEFEAALALQRRLVYQVSGEPTSAALVLCEHPPLITVGRHGSWSHIHLEPEELQARRWRVRWVNRGGGCLLHVPGQFAFYPVLALDHLGLSVQAYLDRLHAVFVDLLGDFRIRAELRPGQPGVWVGDRLIASIGVAVRNWVTYYGAVLNVNPDLRLLRHVRAGAKQDGPMTSLERERRGRLRPSLVRERLLEHFANRFAFARTSLFFEHPMLSRKASADAIPTRR